MTIGVWVLGDQLGLAQAALASCAEERSPVSVILIESLDYCRQRRYHRQKLVLVWSAMRHFAATLREQGWVVTYAIASDFTTPLQQWIREQGITELRIMAPSDRPFLQVIDGLNLPCSVTILPNNQFLWSVAEFRQWGKGRKRFLMEDFYREGRKRLGILMQGDGPIGGKWNFDAENRKPPKKGLKPPQPTSFEPNAITQAVMAKVQGLELELYGHLQPFRWGVTRQQALAVLNAFIQENLAQFGTYQDAMVTHEGTMWHSLLSPYLNLGLLTPLEVVQSAEKAYYEQNLPLNSVEGFIRQVLGWREYMNGIYHWMGQDYAASNWFDHHLPLPAFFWESGGCNLNCLRQVLSQVEETSYAHHIQRLMVLSNFGLIAGINPQALEDWFHGAFIDAHDWVMIPNVLGMGLFADGGKLASKPYAASANYIDKMSDYCRNCSYDRRQRTGENACPFNYLYWDFIARHHEKLASSGRMGLILGVLRKINPQELAKMQALSDRWRREVIPKV
jgi:deoxyribodipyrimidine photolyase-related protein